MIDLYIEALQLRSFSITQGTFYVDFPGHTHANNCFELHYVTDGRGELVTPLGNFRLRKNNIYTTGPDIYHMQKTDPENPMQEFCLFFEVRTIPSDSILKIFFSKNFWIGRSTPAIKKLFCTIYKLYQDQSLINMHQTALLVELLLLEFAHMYEPEIMKITNKTDAGTINDTMKIDWFFLYGGNDITVESLAENLNLSVRQTQRILKKNYGKTFRQKKQDARLERAKLLLSSGTSSLHEIAEECGFYGDAAFCNFFKKQTGMTPTQYRNTTLHSLSDSNNNLLS